MPRLPIDYANTVIYKIVCNDLSINYSYVGHTTDLVRRKGNHKNRCKNEKDKRHNLKIYRIIRENGGWENFTMVVIELFPCNNSIEACKRERELYEELDCKMNTNFPQRDNKEWRIENNYTQCKKYREKNKEQLAMKKKEWSKSNKEEVAIKSKEYRKNNKEEIAIKQKEYREKNKEKLAMVEKEYGKTNQVEIAKKNKERYERNKEQIKEKTKLRTIICECGKEMNAHKARHLRTQIHKELMLCKNIIL
jgi:hypothetical protein